MPCKFVPLGNKASDKGFSAPSFAVFFAVGFLFDSVLQNPGQQLLTKTPAFSNFARLAKTRTIPFIISFEIPYVLRGHPPFYGLQFFALDFSFITEVILLKIGIKYRLSHIIFHTSLTFRLLETNLAIEFPDIKWTHIQRKLKKNGLNRTIFQTFL